MTTYMSKETYEKLVGKSIDIKTNKYKNKKVYYDGRKFDSQKEYSWYIKYKLMEQAGIIEDLRCQVEYELLPQLKINGKTYQKTIYKADFVYKQDGKEHVIDVKGVKTDVYRLKKKLMIYKHGIEIEEI